MRITKKRAIRFSILLVASIAFYVTKPGGNPFGLNDEDGLHVADQETWKPTSHEKPEHVSHDESPNEGDSSEVHSRGIRPDSGLADAGGKKIADKENPKKTEAVAGHGPDSVVRAAEEAGGKKRRKRRLATPDWLNPEKLGFRQFKALRREFRQGGDFKQETIQRLHGAGVIASGAIMPIDPVPSDGVLKRFWLANPVVVMAGCVFCNPPTMGDLVYVETEKKPLVVDRERLYRSVVNAKLLGRLKLGPGSTADGVEYMFSLELKEKVE